MFESRISAGPWKNYLFLEKSDANISSWSYDMEGHAKRSVERYCKLANKTTQQLYYKVATPCIDDHHFKEEEMRSVGELSKVCSQIVLDCLFLARIGRPDILGSVNKLARAVTKWTKACDKRLALLISSCEFRQYCYVGNTAQQCRLGLFQDSDFAGDLEDSKSTSGGLLCIFGSQTSVPISWMCKKQTSVSHSSAEAEIISLDAGLGMDGIPALDLWDFVIEVFHSSPNQANKARDLEELQGNLLQSTTLNMRSQIPTKHTLDLTNNDHISSNVKPYGSSAMLYVFEDDEAVIKMIIKGRSPTIWDMCRELTELLLIGCLTESTWNQSSKLNMMAPKTKLLTSWPKQVSREMSGITCCVRFNIMSCSTYSGSHLKSFLSSQRAPCDARSVQRGCLATKIGICGQSGFWLELRSWKCIDKRRFIWQGNFGRRTEPDQKVKRTLLAQGNLMQYHQKWRTWDSLIINTWKRYSNAYRRNWYGILQNQCIDMVECSSHRRWKPPFFLGQISSRIRKSTRTQDSECVQHHSKTNLGLLITILDEINTEQRWSDQVGEGKNLRTKLKISRSIPRTKTQLDPTEKQLNSSGNNFPGFTTLIILQEIQEDLEEKNIKPENFKDRIIFMSMLNDILWKSDDQNWTLRKSRVTQRNAYQDIELFWVQGRKRNGTVAHMMDNGTVQSTKWYSSSKKLVILFS